MADEKYQITEKGRAAVAAIKSGLCPQVEGGWDMDKFEKFWCLYEGDTIERQCTTPGTTYYNIEHYRDRLLYRVLDALLDPLPKEFKHMYKPRGDVDVAVYYDSRDHAYKTEKCLAFRKIEGFLMAALLSLFVFLMLA